MSLGSAAAAMGWDESKLSRIENAKARLRPQDVQPLLKVYGVEAVEVVEPLEGLAKDAGKQGWWQPYGDVVANGYKDYLTLESDAEWAVRESLSRSVVARWCEVWAESAGPSCGVCWGWRGE